MDSNHPHSKDVSAAVLSPGPEYLLAVAELSVANIKLFNQWTGELAKISTVDREFKLEYRPEPTESWVHIQTGANLKEVVKVAVQLVDQFYITKTCPKTGLEDLYIDFDREGGVMIDDRSQFPIHIVAAEPNPFTPENEEFLIEATINEEGPVTPTHNYNVYTRHCVEDEWEPLHSCYEDLSPGAAIDRFSSITGVEMDRVDSNAATGLYVDRESDIRTRTRDSDR